ncbi:MAG: rhomboid family intramembrane serine protease [Nitriliruptorales bacterium]|nr:rhomboid family intramembrane serine protease [Nitriliruptorales bacterium]
MVIPIADENPTRRRPVWTLTILAVNVAVFLLAQPWDAGACAQQAFFLEWGAVPHEIVSGEALDQREVDHSTLAECDIDAAPEKNVHLSILSAMFLHAGWGHLLGNMLFLWIFGNNVEDRIGRAQFLIFYLTCGAIATLVFVLLNAGSLATLVGASGAIAGILGAYLVMFPRARVTLLVIPLFFLPLRLPALIVLGGWFVLQLFAGQVADMAGGGVAYLAHVAGFVAGVLIVLALGYRPQRPRVRQRFGSPRRDSPGWPPPRRPSGWGRR